VLFHSSDKVEKAAEKHYKWAKWAENEPSEPAATSVLARRDGRCVDQGLRPKPSKVDPSETGPDPAQPIMQDGRFADIPHYFIGIQTVSLAFRLSHG
jgi:hypothetical protein